MRLFKTSFFSILIFTLLISSVNALPAQPNAAQMKALLNNFEKYVKKEMPKWQVPGMAIGIVQGDKLIYTKAFGVKTVGKKAPVTPETVFQVGSTSKAFTSAQVAMLVDEGQFKWDDKVVSYLPDFKMYDPWVTKEFMIEDLMAQRSGLPPYAGDLQSFFGHNREHIIKSLAYIKPVSSFRSRFAYQNGLFLVTAKLIEKKTGLSWEANMNNNIFEPLGMTASTTGLRAFLKEKNAASLHLKRQGKVFALPATWRFHDWCYVYGPAGGINSNVIDMSKWLRLQIHSGSFEGTQLISRESVEYLHSPEILALASSEGNSYYCEGWVYKENEPYPIIWHNGGTSGCKTMVAFVPQAEVGIVILSNLISELPDALGFQFFDLYFGKPDRDRSGTALALAKEKEAKAAAEEPQPPAVPAPALTLEAYTGQYKNDVYGAVKVAKQKDGLSIVIGPSKVKLLLSPFNGNTFAVSLPDWDDHFGQAEFAINPAGKATGLTLTALNADGCGVFKKSK
jgi:CubicO group peptidase (beta-lactamase class C family)